MGAPGSEHKPSLSVGGRVQGEDLTEEPSLKEVMKDGLEFARVAEASSSPCDVSSPLSQLQWNL